MISFIPFIFVWLLLAACGWGLVWNMDLSRDAKLLGTVQISVGTMITTVLIYIAVNIIVLGWSVLP